MSDKDYKEGARAAIELYNSKHFAWVHKPIRGEDAMRFYLPPVQEALIQVVTPLPKPRKDWIKGFEEEQMNILKELQQPTKEK